MQTMTATYSPDDNKLRLYSATRLDSETFARIKAAGFRWAPKQDLFVAPAWTPERADLLVELGTFDRIVMNPPFKDGADVKHVLHAPRGVRMSRGSAVHANGMLVSVATSGDVERIR